MATEEYNYTEAFHTLYFIELLKHNLLYNKT